MFGLLRRLISMSLKLGVLAGGIGAIIGYANLSDLDWTCPALVPPQVLI
jgi:hypothetical protein